MGSQKKLLKGVKKFRSVHKKTKAHKDKKKYTRKQFKTWLESLDTVTWKDIEKELLKNTDWLDDLVKITNRHEND